MQLDLLNLEYTVAMDQCSILQNSRSKYDNAVASLEHHAGKTATFYHVNHCNNYGPIPNHTLIYDTYLYWRLGLTVGI